MTADALLAWARGPAFDWALGIFVLGMLLRLFEILSLGKKTDLSEGRGSGVEGGIRTVFTRTLPRAAVFAREPVRIINGYVFHIGFLLVLAFYGPHIEIFQTKLGISWPALPSGVIDGLAVVTLISLILALVMRLNSPVLRFLSTAGDYVAWAVTALPVLTGFMAFNHLLLPYTTMLAIHLLSVELLLVVAPFSKLTHIFSFAMSRWYQGYQAGHRGIES
jgi:nitrate reductase gamma subunit